MILDYQNLHKNVEEFNTLLKGPGFIQKIYSTARFIAIAIRIQGATIYLYLGRGSKFEGFWISDKPPVAELRKKDQFLEYIRKYMSGGIIQKIEIDPLDRIIYLPYAKNSKINYLGIFWKGRHLFFSHLYFSLEKDKFIKFCSWQAVSNEYDTEFENSLELQKDFNLIGRKQLDNLKSVTVTSSINDLIDDEKNELKKIDNKKKKFIEKKLENIRTDLHNCLKWKVVQEKLDNNQLQLNLFLKQKKFNIDGIEFKNDNLKNEYQLKNIIFEKIKKLKSGSLLLTERERETALELEKLTKESVFVNNLKVIKPFWKHENSLKIKVAENNHSKNYLIFQLRNIKFAIGLTAQGNDLIRKEFAAKDDVWMHLENVTGSHLIVKVKNITELKEIDIATLGSALKHYSKSNSSLISILYTQVKFVRSIKGSPGLVKFSKEKYLTVEFLANWKENLIEITH